jgi:hypothetical protein
MLNRMKIGILYLKYQIRWRFVDFVKPSAPFLTTAGIKFHMARQEHLKFFRSVIDEKNILEVGAGIGLFSEKIANQAKSVLVTEGRSPLVRVMRKRLRTFHNVSVLKVDVENPKDIKLLRSRGKYDLLLCYGLLYHLSNPAEFLRNFSPLTKNMILETVVDFSSENWTTVRENPRPTQAIHLGCRPNPDWLLEEMKKYFDYVYVCRVVPNHPDFLWESTSSKPTRHSRMIFVCSNDSVFEGSSLVAPYIDMPFSTALA